MKKSPHSQSTWRNSAGPNRKRRACGVAGKVGRQTGGDQQLKPDEPDLPKGYRQIRDAIRALLTLDSE